MKVGFVHPGHPLGEGTGAVHSASRIVFELAARDHAVTVYCMDDPPDGRETDADIAFRTLDLAGYPYQTGLQLDAALRERVGEFDQYDLVHSYTMDAIPALAEIGTTTSAATVVTLNAYGGVCPKHDLRYLDREPCTSNGLAKCTACSVATCGGHDRHGRAYRLAGRLGSLKLVRDTGRVADRIDGYHALSPHIETTYAAFGFPCDRLGVVPNVLDERFRRAHTSEFADPFELLYVGELAGHKGVDQLVPILDALNRRSAAEFRLTVVGDGGKRDQLHRQANARNLAGAVTVTGWLPNDELPGVYASHDLFCYPGRWDEPFGRVFLEALAAGTPVVASDVGSVAAIVGDGGRTTDGSVDGFVDAILALTEAGRLEALSAAAKRTAEEYRPETVVPALVGLYEDALDR